MTVKELKKKLKNYPDNWEVYIYSHWDSEGEFSIGMVEESMEEDVVLINTL